MARRGEKETLEFSIGGKEESRHDVDDDDSGIASDDLSDDSGDDDYLSNVRVFYPVLATPRFEHISLLEELCNPNKDNPDLLKTIAGAIMHSCSAAQKGHLHGNIHPGNIMICQPEQILTNTMIEKLWDLAHGQAGQDLLCLKNLAAARLAELNETIATAPVTFLDKSE
ncbi:hypothetical protein RhiLY_05615 [Ceratobasidium sp. AG-Ba]|nr:hypothetical protein RhiLY_05615 [Ceratobasidium sp. AG-Ba]